EPSAFRIERPSRLLDLGKAGDGGVDDDSGDVSGFRRTIGRLSETRRAVGGLPHTRRAGGGATGLIRSTGRGGRDAVEVGQRLRQTCIGDGFTGGDDGELGGPGRAFEVLEL